MSKEGMVPKVRFYNFNDEWFIKSLEEISEIIMGQSPKSEYYTDNPSDYILVQGNADIKNGSVAPRAYTSKPTKLAEKGNIILTVRAPVGEVAKTDYEVVLGRGVSSLKGNEFLYQKLLMMNKVNYWEKFSTGSTFQSINSNDIRNAKLLVPIAEEQQKIGQLFEKLDQAISLQQQVLEATKDYKQSMLQKMFPKKDEKVPEIRFNGFNLDWKKCKLGDRGKTISGTGFPKKEQGGLNGIPFYKVSDMNLSQNKNTMYVSNNYVSQSQVLQKKWEVITDTPAVIFAKVGAAIMLNRKRLANKPFLIDNNMMAFIPNTSEIESTFIKILFETIFLPKYAQVGALPSYNGSDIEAIPIKIPTLNEQQKIGSFFKTLDEKIEQEEKKLKTYQSMKKALMQRMFV